MPCFASSYATASPTPLPPPVTTATSPEGNLRSEEMNAYPISLRFSSVAVGSQCFTDARSFQIPAEEVDIAVRGGNYMTIHNSSEWRITEDSKPLEWREPPTFTGSGDSGNEIGHLAEIVDFSAAVQEGRTTRSNIDESYKSTVLYEAIRESAETGEVVEVGYREL